MNDELLKQIFVLFDRCQSAGRALQIDIEEELLPLYPVGLPVLVNSLSEAFPSSFLRLTSERKRLLFDNRVRTFSLCTSLSDTSLVDSLRTS